MLLDWRARAHLKCSTENPARGQASGRHAPVRIPSACARRIALRFLLFGLCLSAGAAGIQVTQDYDWPAEARARCIVRDGDLLVVLGWGAGAVSPPGLSAGGLAGVGLSGIGLPAGGAAMEGPLLGVCLPWLRFGPLLPRGLLRQVSNPLGFSPSSDVFQERTTLVLDGELSSASQGVLLMPACGLCGVFCRPVRAGGNEYGAFGRVPLAPGAAAEAALLASRPRAQEPPDEWFLSHGPFPGGDITELCARFAASSPALGFSLTSGISSARWTSPGCLHESPDFGKRPLAPGCHPAGRGHLRLPVAGWLLRGRCRASLGKGPARK